MRLRHVAALALLFFASVSATAAPPEVPAAPVKVKAGKSTQVKIGAEKGKPIIYAEAFRASDLTVFRGHAEEETEVPFLVIPHTPGFYRVPFLTVGEKKFSYLEIDATEGTVIAPPPKDKDPKDKDPKDPPVVGGSIHFLVVGADGPALPAVTRTLLLPEWDALVKAGHRFGYKTVSEAKKLNVSVPAGTVLPAVVGLRTGDGIPSVVLGWAPMPTTGGGVAALPEAFRPAQP